MVNASALFDCTGTSVWIYGAKGNNHGEYVVEVDQEIYPQFDGFNDGGLFQQVLFSADELNHTEPYPIWIINTHTDAARPYLDIDSVSILIL